MFVYSKCQYKKITCEILYSVPLNWDVKQYFPIKSTEQFLQLTVQNSMIASTEIELLIRGYDITFNHFKGS